MLEKFIKKSNRREGSSQKTRGKFSENWVLFIFGTFGSFLTALQIYTVFNCVPPSTVISLYTDRNNLEDSY